jgi:rsbT co-antagonist protein RsbR
MADFARFFRTSHELLAITGVNGHFVELNPMWTQVLGHSLDTLRASHFLEFVHPDDRETTVTEVARLQAQGGETTHFENRYRRSDGRYCWLSWSAVLDLETDLTYCCAHDVTPFKEALADREQALALTAQFEADYRRIEDELRQRVEAQQQAIESMSTPIIQVWDDIVTMPVVGLVDSMRAADMKNSLLETVARTRAKFAIVDLTGVDTVDTATADHLLKVMRAVGLLGARCVITGIQPSVAQIIVGLGLDMQGVTTLRSLREGLKYCMRTMGLTVTRVAPTSPDGAA